MQKQMPGSEFKVEGEIPFVGLEDDRSFNAFKAKMEAAVQATKNKSKASKEKKKVERVYQKGRLCSQLKRTQRYLGLRPLGEAGSKTANPYSIPGLSLAKLQKAVEERAPASVFVLPELKATQSAPYSFDSSVVFICVDVESYERDHNLITEIGIATLDTKDLIDVSPGEGGIEWMNKIRARHLRIKERTHLVNKDFVNGCADRFEKSFGTSEFISIKEAPQVVASCFRSPFSAVKENSNINVEDKEDEKRNLILVGHNTKADIDYLRQLGYDPSNLSNLLEVLDTADLFRALKYENSGRGLGSLLLDLGLPGWNLHNAVSLVPSTPGRQHGMPLFLARTTSTFDAETCISKLTDPNPRATTPHTRSKPSSASPSKALPQSANAKPLSAKRSAKSVSTQLSKKPKRGS